MNFESFIKKLKIYTKMKKIIIFVIVSIFYVSCQQEITLEGTVEGRFSIGPLCGIEPANADENHPCGLSFEQLDAIYGKYTVQLINASTAKVIAEKKMDRTGLYSFSVPDGVYNLYYQPQVTTTNKIQKLPTGFKVSAGQKTTMDISIDTGLR
jgi:hypothetical protein